MEKDLNKLLEAIHEAEFGDGILTMGDLLKVVTISDIADLCEMPEQNMKKWISEPGTLPEKYIKKVASELELQPYLIRKLFGVELDPNKEALELYKREVESGPYGKLQRLVAMAEEVKKAFGGALSVIITLQK